MCDGCEESKGVTLEIGYAHDRPTITTPAGSMRSISVWAPGKNGQVIPPDEFSAWSKEKLLEIRATMEGSGRSTSPTFS
jgi:hypothetical protein